MKRAVEIHQGEGDRKVEGTGEGEWGDVTGNGWRDVTGRGGGLRDVTGREAMSFDPR